jgi:hypothetical protein
VSALFRSEEELELPTLLVSTLGEFVLRVIMRTSVFRPKGSRLALETMSGLLSDW